MFGDRWNKNLMELAIHVSTMSKDPDHKVGAIIVNHDRIVVGMGFNGFPRGVQDTPYRYEDKIVKRKIIVHAEANAILNSTTSVRGLTMFTTRFPCSECAKLIIQSGISQVLTYPLERSSTWAADAEWTKIMFREAAVHLHEVIL